MIFLWCQYLLWQPWNTQWSFGQKKTLMFCSNIILQIRMIFLMKLIIVKIGTVHIYLAGLVCTILSEKPDIYKPEHRNTEWCSHTFRNVAMWNLNSCQASVGFDILFVCSMVNQLQLIFLSYFQVNISNLIIWFTFLITETRGKIVQFHLYLWLWHGGSQSVIPPSIS